MPFYLAVILFAAAVIGIICSAVCIKKNRVLKIILLVVLSIAAALLLLYIALTVFFVYSVAMY